MEKKTSLKAAAIAAGAAMIATVPAQANIFEANDLGSGAELRQELTSNTDNAFVSNAELKCGEGSCGEKESKSEKKSEKKAESKETKAKESKTEEHKCGEGKCGENTCGGK
jgi:uncharacterized low-complexity protein